MLFAGFCCWLFGDCLVELCWLFICCSLGFLFVFRLIGFVDIAFLLVLLDWFGWMVCAFVLGFVLVSFTYLRCLLIDVVLVSCLLYFMVGLFGLYFDCYGLDNFAIVFAVSSVFIVRFGRCFEFVD